MPKTTLHSESFTSAAIDGARISAMTASLLTELDRQLPDAQRLVILDAIDNARLWLDAAREALPVPVTSIHVVPQGTIIIPP